MDWLIAHFGAIVFYFLAAVRGRRGHRGDRLPQPGARGALAAGDVPRGGRPVRAACTPSSSAAVQILVYAGGIMVLFLFVIMLVNVRTIPEEPSTCGASRRPRWGSAWPPGGAGGRRPAGRRRAAPRRARRRCRGRGPALGNTEAVGWSLYRDYLLPFEVVSIVLLVAMIGAIVMGRKETGKEEGA